MLKKLNRDTIALQPQRPVRVLQFGGGNFLRGFADWIIDVLNERTSFNGSIDIITSITPGTAEQINEQQGLYHLVQQGTMDGRVISETGLITAVNAAVNPAKSPDKFLNAAVNPDLRFIISNTTEQGIAFDESDSSVDSLAKSFPGKLTQVLYQRFSHFRGAEDKTLIILPCELIESNGDVLRNMVERYAKHWNLAPEFAGWLAKNTFCNTLVDRIVPGFPKDQSEEIQARVGFEDKLIVAAEPYYFWAIEAPAFVRDEFPVGEAGLDNIVFTDDIAPYRTRKVRILNGAHTALTPVAYLRGLRTVREAMEDPYAGKFITDTIINEIISTMSLPEDELRKFASAVADRFRNPFIRHMLISISLNSVSKFKVRILPTILDFVRLKKRLPENLVTAFAALLCFYRGKWNGEPIPLNDSPEVLDIFKNAWSKNSVDDTVGSILSNASLWGRDLTDIDGFTASVNERVRVLLHEEGKTKSATVRETP